MFSHDSAFESGRRPAGTDPGLAALVNVLGTSAEGVFVQDEHGRYVFVNPAGARFFGQPAERVLGRTSRELFGHGLGSRVAAIERQVASAGRPRSFRLRRRLAGARHTFLVTEHPHFGPDQKLLGLVGFIRDVSEKPAATADGAGRAAPRMDMGTAPLPFDLDPPQVFAGALATAVAPRSTDVLRLNRALLSLQSAAAAVASSLNLQHVLETFSWEMTNLLDATACFVYEWQKEADAMALIATYQVEDGAGGKPVPQYLLANRPAARRTLNERMVQQFHHSDAEVEATERRIMADRGVQTLMLLPLVFQDRMMGLVEISDQTVQREFGDQEISLAQLLANQAAAAVANARLYEELEQRLQELSGLNQIGQAITSTLDLEKTLTIITNHTLSLLRVEAASVALLDKERGDIWYAAVSGGVPDFVLGKRLQVGQGIIGQVVQQGEPLLIADVAQDRRHFREFDARTGFRTRSILCVPLQAQGEVIGAIQAINRIGGYFTREDMRLLSSLAAPAAAAIVNARLYQRARQEISERMRAEKQIQTSLAEKEVLLKEIHHRVKNNLQVISSLINLQADFVEDQRTIEIFQESQNRIRSMALIHEKLYQSRNLAHIDLAEYVGDLTSYLFRSYSAAARGIELEVAVDNVFLGINTAVPCGLMLNELVSNSLKHAFPNSQPGHIWIRARAGADRRLELVVGDDGAGFPPDLDFRQTTSLGLQLVNTLVSQLDGEIALQRSPQTNFHITFTIPKEND